MRYGCALAGRPPQLSHVHHRAPHLLAGELAEPTRGLGSSALAASRSESWSASALTSGSAGGGARLHSSPRGPTADGRRHSKRNQRRQRRQRKQRNKCNKRNKRNKRDQSNTLEQLAGATIQLGACVVGARDGAAELAR